MKQSSKRVRVLYSFPHKLGADRICYTAWQQVNGLAAAGADILVYPGVLHRPVPAGVEVQPTLAWGKLRVPYKLIGKLRALAMHDQIVARRIEKLAGRIDIIHTWPMAAIKTLQTASRLGIPTVLERPNAHTRYAYEVVQRECARLGVTLPPGHEYEFNTDILDQEEAEYRLADRLLCPSDFVARTFLDKGFRPENLARHQYGFDDKLYRSGEKSSDKGRGLTMLFVGECAVRKGVHYALEAWLQSPAHRNGTFMIAGTFVPGYAEKLAPLLAHPSVQVLGHRSDVPDLMHKSDIVILPSLEEGSALVTSEARGSGCVLLVSEAAGANCIHMENGLVHEVGDIKTITQHITMLNDDRALLAKLRLASSSTLHELTWDAAGVRLLNVYREVIAGSRKPLPSVAAQSASLTGGR